MVTVPVRSCFKVWLRTEEYLKDALGSVVTDIEDVAINLLAFVNAQVRRVFFCSTKKATGASALSINTTAMSCENVRKATRQAGAQGYGIVWYGMVWYGMVWYGMVWYGMVSRTFLTTGPLVRQ